MWIAMPRPPRPLPPQRHVAVPCCAMWELPFAHHGAAMDCNGILQWNRVSGWCRLMLLRLTRMIKMMKMDDHDDSCQLGDSNGCKIEARVGKAPCHEQAKKTLAVRISSAQGFNVHWLCWTDPRPGSNKNSVNSLVNLQCNHYWYTIHYSLIPWNPVLNSLISRSSLDHNSLSNHHSQFHHETWASPRSVADLKRAVCGCDARDQHLDEWSSSTNPKSNMPT